MTPLILRHEYVHVINAQCSVWVYNISERSKKNCFCWKISHVNITLHYMPYAQLIWLWLLPKIIHLWMLNVISKMASRYAHTRLICSASNILTCSYIINIEFIYIICMHTRIHIRTVHTGFDVISKCWHISIHKAKVNTLRLSEIETTIQFVPC